MLFFNHYQPPKTWCMQGCPIYGNAFSTNLYHLFQSTDKKIISGRIYGFFLTRLGYYPPPPIALLRLAAFRARRVNFFGLPRSGRLPKSHDFLEFRLGNPVYEVKMMMVLLSGFKDSCRWWRCLVDLSAAAPEHSLYVSDNFANL